MAYVAVKGGDAAILASHALLDAQRRGDPAVPALSAVQLREQQGRAVDRAMAEGGLHDPDLAALALKQAQGDAVEAAFLLRAHRATLEGFGATTPLDTAAMRLTRRISAAYKDAPGGQVLGPTVDYTHRLLDFALVEDAPAPPEAEPIGGPSPRVADIVVAEGWMAAEPPPEGDPAPPDLTRGPLRLPADRATRLQALARGDEGFLLGLAYSTQRGYGGSHPYVGELRVGVAALEMTPPELGFAVEIGDVTLTECEMINAPQGSPPRFTRGYGLAFGCNERRAMAMALVERALRAAEFGEEVRHPAQDEEFVLAHCDNVESSGFVQHLKLPHYVDFQSELQMLREMAAEDAARRRAAE